MSRDNDNEDRQDTGHDNALPPGIVRSKPKAAAGREAPTPCPSPATGEGSLINESGFSNKVFVGSGDSFLNELPSPVAGEGQGVGASTRKGRETLGGPARITAIEPQQKRKGRVNVFIDGQFAAGLFDTVALDLGLRVGQAITPERLDEIAQAETLRRAKEDAYHLLSFRARSEKEISDRLVQKGYEADVIVLVAESLRQIGLLDDEAFAQNWVNARGKTRGNRMLAHELRQKGVASDLAAQTLQEQHTGENEHTAAYQAAVKKVGERPADTSREARAKVAAHLARRGFGWDVVKPVLAQLYAVRESENTAEAADENTDENAE